MKVRCIDGSWSSNELTTGKEYEVLSEVGCYYQLKINDKGISYQCYVKSRFEVIKEENKMEKTFREVIADIKEGEVWESAQDCFQLKEISCIGGRILFKLVGVFVEKTDNVNSVDTGAGGGQTFKLQRKQYTFEEVFKAHEEGKVIESCYSQYKYKRANGVDLYSRTENNWYKDDNFEIDEIRGKWYINN